MGKEKKVETIYLELSQDSLLFPMHSEYLSMGRRKKDLTRHWKTMFKKRWLDADSPTESPLGASAHGHIQYIFTEI